MKVLRVIDDHWDYAMAAGCDVVLRSWMESDIFIAENIRWLWVDAQLMHILFALWADHYVSHLS